MTSIDTDFGFDAVFRKSASELKMQLARDADSIGGLAPVRRRANFGTVLIFGCLGIFSAAIVIIGCSAIQSDSPEIWIHRLMALAFVQSILIGAVAVKALPHFERWRARQGFGGDNGKSDAVRPRKIAAPRTAPVPPPLPEPPKPVIGGQIAGREFLQHGDGSVEIDTRVGRRRFVSIEAAKEFVGS